MKANQTDGGLVLLELLEYRLGSTSSSPMHSDVVNNEQLEESRLTQAELSLAGGLNQRALYSPCSDVLLILLCGCDKKPPASLTVLIKVQNRSDNSSDVSTQSFPSMNCPPTSLNHSSLGCTLHYIHALDFSFQPTAKPPRTRTAPS